MAGEDEVRRAVADPGEEIVDIGRAGLMEDFARASKTRGIERALQYVERAGVLGGHRGTAQQFAREFHGGRERRHFSRPGANPNW